MNATKAMKKPSGGLIQLIRGYVLQETVEPLRYLGWAFAFGLAGAMLASLGLSLALLGLLRLLQLETGQTFAGAWSFAPYLITAATGAAVVAVAVVATLRTTRSRP